jgi:hypothetical protein
LIYPDEETVTVYRQEGEPIVLGNEDIFLTESIQDTSFRIHPWRNKKPVSDETCPPNLSVGSMLQSKI